MNSPTEEQKLIVDRIGEGKNVIVDAVAGSGKTTTVLWVAKSNPHKKILQLTYNRSLKDEVCEKRDTFNLNNLEVQTYHGFASKLFKKSIHNDNLLIDAIRNKGKITYSVDILVLDEVQDMTANYFTLSNIVTSKVMVLLGDPYQMIYKYKGANLDYLFNRGNIWNRVFEKLTLTISFRLTHQMGSFMNEVVLRENRFHTVKVGPKVNYLHVNPFEAGATMIYTAIADLLKEGYRSEDIFILASSVKSMTSPFNYLLNELSRNNVPIYKPINDEEKLTESVIENKIVVSTFHQAKGRERKIVVVYGFDSFLRKTWKDVDFQICPEFVYVALTRAKEHLFIVHSEKDEKLPFIKHKLSEIKSLDYIKFTGSMKDGIYTQLVGPRNITVTNMVSYLNSELEYELEKALSGIISMQSTGSKIMMTNEIRSEKFNTVEPVSHLNGLAIPALYEKKKTGKSRMEEEVKRDKRYSHLRKESAETVADMLLFANIYTTITNGNLDHYLNQIQSYDWLPDSAVDLAHNNLDGILTDASMTFEETVTYSDIEVVIDGAVDCIQGTTLWEFKCVSAISISHFLQTVVYAWMSRLNGIDIRRICLYNISGGELYEIQTDYKLLEQVFTIIKKAKLKQDYDPELEQLKTKQMASASDIKSKLQMKLDDVPDDKIEPRDACLVIKPQLTGIITLTPKK